MNKEITENYFISNGSEYPASQTSEITISQPSIYEVIRVIDGVPLFLGDHMERLESSAASLDTTLKPLMPQLYTDIRKLIKINQSPNKNIKLWVFNLEKDIPDYIMCFIKSAYPTKEQYLKGIHTVVLDAERNNPNAKVLNLELRSMVDKKLKEQHAFEALLVNNKGEITEGSKSNLFFVVQGKIFTSPAQDVLIGITRKYILEACRSIGLEVVEQPIPFSILDYAEGAFITGTSPKLLPIASVEEKQLDSANNETVDRILKEYDRILENYISANK